MLKWIDKFFQKFKSKIKNQVIINDACDLLDIQSSRKGKIIVIKSGDVEYFLNEFTVPDKFFYVDIFDDSKNTFIDLLKEGKDVDRNIEIRARLRLKLNHGDRFQDNDLNLFINNLVKKGLK